MYYIQGGHVAQLKCRGQSCAARSRLVVAKGVPPLVGASAAWRHPQHQQPLQQHQQRPRSTVTAQAIATETVAGTGWLRTLIPFGRKATAEPVIPVISAQQLQVHLQECSDRPLVVIFSAVWCGPCKVMMQRLENLATELGPQVKVVKIDTDESEGGSELATQLGIHKLPTMVFCGPQEGQSTIHLQGLVKQTVMQDLVLNRCQYLGNDLQKKMAW